jgi:hypothetical protein
MRALIAFLIIAVTIRQMHFRTLVGPDDSSRQLMGNYEQEFLPPMPMNLIKGSKDEAVRGIRTSAVYKSPQVEEERALILEERAPEPIDICFVSSIFGPTVKTADRPHDFTKFQMGNTTSFQFFMYTNLGDLESPGWTKVLRNFTYRRFITQSRWGKFMAWKDPEMNVCQTIFYFDGHFKPDASPKLFADLAKQIRESEVGLVQRLHASKPSPIEEFEAILKGHKDISKNVNASIEWLQAQPDFYNNCTMYNNGFFGKSITCVFLFKRCCC